MTDAFDLFGANMWELYDKDAAPGRVGHSLPIVTFRNSDGLWCAVGFDYAGEISSSSSTKSKKTSYGTTEIDAIMQTTINIKKINE